MGTDAHILLRPRRPSLLRGVLDPETESVDVLDDGSLLVSTFVRYRAIEHDLDEGRAILTRYGHALIDAHDDPRGVLFIPETSRGRSYDAIVLAMSDAACWVPAAILTHDEEIALARRRAGEFKRSTRRAPDPDASASMEDLMARIGAMLTTPGTVETFGRVIARGATAMLLQRPSRTPLSSSSPWLSVNELLDLDDGTLAVRTDRAGDDGAELVALALGGDLAEWVSEHGDPRGVPTFWATTLDAIAGAKTYEDAVALLGDALTFVRPHTIEDSIAAQKARFRAYLESD